jgi:hypothetical protein
VLLTRIDGWETYVAQADVFDERWIDLRLGKDLLHNLDDEGIERGILEPSLERLGERRADRKRDNNIIGVLRCAGKFLVSLSSRSV